MYDRYCDHEWSRDDANCEICVRCHKRREIRSNQDKEDYE